MVVGVSLKMTLCVPTENSVSIFLKGIFVTVFLIMDSVQSIHISNGWFDVPVGPILEW